MISTCHFQLLFPTLFSTLFSCLFGLVACQMATISLSRQFYFLYRPSPEWLLSCPRCVPKLADLFPQNVQTYGFSPVWVFMWSFKSRGATKDFGHSVHLCLLSSIAACFCCICLLSCVFFTIAPHVEHGTITWVYCICFSAKKGWFTFFISKNMI